MSYQHDDGDRDRLLSHHSHGAVPQLDESASCCSRRMLTATVVMLLVACAIGAAVLIGRGGVSPSGSGPTGNGGVAGAVPPPYSFDQRGSYVLPEFDTAKPFSSFLPGMAGLDGKPMWAFYVNRGQCIAGFGVKMKDEPIMEFQTANIAYEMTPRQGFRTFVQGVRGGVSWNYEPFMNNKAAAKIPTTRHMMIGLNELAILEVNNELGLRTEVLYYTLAREKFPGLVRRVNLTNSGDTPLTIAALDGLAKMQPFGVNDWVLKHMGRTGQAWYNVYNLDTDNGMPFYRLSASLNDGEVVVPVIQGNWAVGFVEGANGEILQRLPFVVDPEVVFGDDMSLAEPLALRTQRISDVIANLASQVTTTRTGTAFAAMDSITLQPGETVSITTIYGRAPDVNYLHSVVAPTVFAPGYVRQKRITADAIVKDLTDVSTSKTGSMLFDKYVQQNFLDNSLRGGYPIMLGKQNKAYYTFGRIHGDMERDYNYFVVEPEYFSHGPGNYRDVNQNRRNNVMFEPLVNRSDARYFWSLMQADAYNPLSILSSNFVLTDAQATSISAASTGNDRDASVMRGMLLWPVVGFDMFRAIDFYKVTLTVGIQDLMDTIADAGVQHFDSDFKEGFWADHWTYNLDLVQSYLQLYPDEATRFFFEDPLPFFQSPHSVQPRSKKYVMLANIEGIQSPRQLGASYRDEEKASVINRNQDPHSKKHQLDKNGVLFTLPLVSKMFMMAVLKFATMDSAGMGIEMEAGKPGWLDALNGLPALFGSGMPETYEALRLIYFLQTVDLGTRTVTVPLEFQVLLSGIDVAYATWDKDFAEFAYWDSVSTAREVCDQLAIPKGTYTYRAAVRLTFLGDRVELSAKVVTAMLSKMAKKIETGIERALALNDGLTPTYFSYDADTFVPAAGQDPQGRAYVSITKFRAHTLPIFLEGFVRQLRVLKTVAARREVYLKARNSPLYDQELKMYRLSASLEDQPHEIGRVKGFAPGWLERESVWTHMSYKFYLELLRGGLYEEFWTEAKTGLVVFMDPKVYGRSPLEASSFIASSAYTDKKYRGTGFVSRLSGATAEFISMYAYWYLEIMVGHQPFSNKNGALSLTFQPAIPGWLFDSAGQVTFRFLGTVDCTYHYAAHGDTWTATIQQITLHFVAAGVPDVLLKGAVITAPYAAMVRNGLVAAIDLSYD